MRGTWRRCGVGGGGGEGAEHASKDRVAYAAMRCLRPTQLNSIPIECSRRLASSCIMVLMIIRSVLLCYILSVYGETLA